jgi:hypothetical protein
MELRNLITRLQRIDEAAHDPILDRALARIPAGLQDNALYDAATMALATEWGLQQMKYEYGVARPYLEKLIGLYKQKHSTTEAANQAQQAAIAISMKEKGQKPKNEGVNNNTEAAVKIAKHIKDIIDSENDTGDRRSKLFILQRDLEKLDYKFDIGRNRLIHLRGQNHVDLSEDTLTEYPKENRQDYFAVLRYWVVWLAKLDQTV